MQQVNPHTHTQVDTHTYTHPTFQLQASDGVAAQKGKAELEFYYAPLLPGPATSSVILTSKEVCACVRALTPKTFDPLLQLQCKNIVKLVGRAPHSFAL